MTATNAAIARRVARALTTGSQKKNTGYFLQYEEPGMSITLDTVTDNVTVKAPHGRLLWATGGLAPRVLEYEPGPWEERLRELGATARENPAGDPAGSAHRAENGTVLPGTGPAGPTSRATAGQCRRK